MNEKIMIKIGGRPIETEIVDGVQRLPCNDLLSSLFDCRALDLNKLAMAYHTGKISFDNYLEYYLNIGYSVSGFSELSAFEHLEIENPLWETK